MVFDKDGALEQICGGKGYIDMSTVDADTSSRISEVGISCLPWIFFDLVNSCLHWIFFDLVNSYS